MISINLTFHSGLLAGSEERREGLRPVFDIGSDAEDNLHSLQRLGVCGLIIPAKVSNLCALLRKLFGAFVAGRAESYAHGGVARVEEADCDAVPNDALASGDAAATE